MTEPAQFTDLKERLASIGDLAGVSQLLYWDQRTKMPVGGSEGRAEQIATVGRLAHELFVDPEVGRLLDACESWADGYDPDSFEASFVRVARRDWEKATCVPPQLTAEMRRAGALALRAWAEARAASDFGKLAPHLERNLELKHRYVACFPRADEAYDILLDEYEPGMRTAEVRAVFDDLKAELLPLIRALGANEPEPELVLPREGQERFAREVLDRLGFDEETWRLDETAHPFMASPGAGDIRLTTRWESGLNWLFGAIHEFGHGVYEHDIDPSLARTPLAGGVSLGIHESQSRMWENLVGRSRPFWRYFYPRLQAAFPQEFGSVDLDTFYRVTNRVEPSFIRVDADEVTYNLHVILRFELEQELIEGRLAVADLPQAWNARFEEYLGIPVPDDRRGVLQDMHWSGGAFGYFPTYSLGNVMSVQIWERMREDLPQVPECFAQGEFDELRAWYREHTYRLGRKFTPQETLRRACGGQIDAVPYLRYLNEKYAAVA